MVRRPGQEQFLFVRADQADLGALTSSRSVGGGGGGGRMFSLEFLARENQDRNY